MCVPLCVLFLEIGIKWLHGVTQGDTQILIKANSYNKTGDLDISLNLPFTPVTRVRIPVGTPNLITHLSIDCLPLPVPGCAWVADGCVIIEAIDGCLIAVRSQVSVYVDGNFDAVMAQLVPDIGQGLAGLNQDARITVPQIMDPDLTQSSFRQSSIE